MAKNKQKIPFKLNIGGPSIILLLTVLGLSVFAILSIRAAYSGLKLARTSRDSVEAYYKVDSIAEETIQSVKAVEGSGSTESIEAAISRLDYVETVSDGTVTIRVPLNDTVSMEVVLDGDEDYSNFKVVSHRLINTVVDDYSFSEFDLVDPIIIE